jgi:predicted transcriptional regulator
MKRTRKEVRKAILKALNDSKAHAYGDIERKANTNWQTVRDHCEDLLLFEAITISKDNKVKITEQGITLLKKISR